MARKITAYFIIVIILFNFGSFALFISAADNSNDIPAPNSISITSSSLDRSGFVSSGDRFRGTVTVTNNSGSRVENVSVISTTSNSNVFIESFSEQIIGTLEAGQSSSVSFTYAVPEGNTGGETQIRFTAYAYADKSEQDSNQITINVIGELPKSEPQDAGFAILASTSPSVIYTTTESFKISIRFSVRGAGVNNVKAEWSASDPEAFEPKSAQTKTLGLMQLYSSEYVEFEISPTHKIAPGAYTIKVNISGVSGAGANNITFDHEVGIFVERGAGDTGQGITVVSTEIPESAKTGDRFQIKFTLQNTRVTARNITVELKTPEGIANSSLHIFEIPSLVRDEQREVVFDLIVTDKAIEHYNRFEIIITHDGVSSTHYTGLNIITEDKSQDIRIVSVNIPESAKAGEEFKITAVVANEGGNEVKNIMIELGLPDGIVNRSPKTVRIDSLAKNGKEQVEFNLRVSENAVDSYYEFELIIEHDSIKRSQFEGLNIMSGNFMITANLERNVKYDTEFTLSFTVKNNGGDVKNLFFSVSHPESIVNTTENIFLIPELKAGQSVTKEIVFIAKEEAAGKTHLFAINISSKGTDRDIIHATQNIVTMVDFIDEFHPALSIDYINIPRATGINSDFNVEIKLSNKGADAQNITLTLEPQTGLINKSSNVIRIDSMPTDGSYTGSFSFMATEAASNSFNSIGIKVEYNYRKAGGATERGEIIQHSGLLVSNPQKTDPSDSSKKDMPVVIISRFGYGGEEVYGGRTFDFEVEFLNTHRTNIVKDLKITLSQDKGIFVPRSGSNTFFVEQLSPGGSIGQSIELIVKTDALPDSYGLTVTLEYKNEDGDATIATEIINIPVQQETRFHIGEVPFISEIEIGDEAYVNIQFGNLGRSTIYNVNVRVESESFYDPDGGYFAGNLEAGKSASKAFYLTPTMPGMAMGKLIFIYENAIGEEFRDETDISFMVMGGDMDFMGGGDFERPDMWGDDGENMIIGYDEEGLPIFAMDGELTEENESFFAWLFTDMGLMQWAIIIGAGVIVVGIVVILVVVIKRKRDKIEDDDL